MSAPVYLSGKYAFFKIGTVGQQFDNWELDEAAEFVDCSNYLSQGHEDGVDGLANGTWSTSGPWDGGTPPAPGSIITVTFGATALITSTRRVYVERAKLSGPLRGKVSIDLSGKVLPIYA